MFQFALILFLGYVAISISKKLINDSNRNNEIIEAEKNGVDIYEIQRLKREENMRYLEDIESGKYN